MRFEVLSASNNVNNFPVIVIYTLPSAFPH